ncbi:MAG TPA: heterodisulfide reductase-related iron-sulfur binding cluster, partial [Candidatus Tectomicrobia bacterium]|nr:heterodisulfide reductase-related iron-sulfur binding cluster [Candidatus Tectomicrobia bacterium]
MEAGRALTLRRRAPLSWRLRAFAIRQLVTRPSRLAVAFSLLRLYQRAGLQTIARRLGLIRLLPASLRMAEASLPRLPRPGAVPESSSDGDAVASVALLTSCVMPYLYPETHHATVRVLRRLGYRVVAPKDMGCCGALSLHAGDLETARACARRVIDAFDATGAEVIVVNAAGCGAAMKEYGHLLQDDAAYAARADAFAGRVRDVIEFIAGHELP